MAVNIPVAKSIRAAMTNGLSAHSTEHELEAANQTFKRGAPLYFVSGLLTEAPATIDAGDVIVGFADANGHNDAGSISTIGYWPALPHAVFVGVLSDASAFTHTLAQADIGGKYGIAKDSSSGAWYLDYNSTTDVGAVVIGHKDAIGTVDGLVYFVVTYACTLYYNGA